MISVCIPTFNRSHELKRLFKSALKSKNSELAKFVVVDDGSKDDTYDVIKSFSELLNISYIYQNNAGRAAAVFRAVSNVESKYCLIMDSDDIFVRNGIDKILDGLEAYQGFDSFVFGVEIVRGEEVVESILFDKITISNFTEARVKSGLRSDLKEVVRSEVIKKALYPEYLDCRRVPTSLLWTRIAENSDCVCLPVVVARKEYLVGGMTDNILALKYENPRPLYDLYYTLATSSRYQSFRFRLKYVYLSVEYALLTENITPILWKILFIVPAKIRIAYNRSLLNR